jgi:DNA-directed RNA polymerase subunit alpha
MSATKSSPSTAVQSPSNIFLLNHPSVKTSLVEHSDSRYSLVIEPLSPGYGYTLGNSLRRIFLSSIPGYGITKIKINDITHEYKAVEGIVEDAMQIILNIKTLRPKIMTNEDRVVLALSKNTAGEVYGRDFNSNSNAMIVNGDDYICTLNKGAKLNIEIEIVRGVGYLSIDDINLSDNKDARQILVDAMFSPVTNVSLDVSKVRVGDNTNFDKLELNFDIDKSVSAIDVANYAFDILLDLINQSKNALKITKPLANDEPVLQVIVEDNAEDSLEEITVSDKVKRILAKNGITRNSDLKKRYSEVADFTGIGAKALTELDDYIKII